MQTLRGVSADVIYCEEMAYMDLAVLYEVVMPLMEMANAILIGISTPVDCFNIFQQLFERRNPINGSPIANCFALELVCDYCKSAESSKEMFDCPHMLKFVPPWKSSEKYEMLKEVFRGNEETLMRESRGVPAAPPGVLVQKPDLEKLRKSCWEFSKLDRPRYILLFCDPNAGARNHMALCSLVFLNGQTIVCNTILMFEIKNRLCEGNGFRLADIQECG